MAGQTMLCDRMSEQHEMGVSAGTRTALGITRELPCLVLAYWYLV